MICTTSYHLLPFWTMPFQAKLHICFLGNDLRPVHVQWHMFQKRTPRKLPRSRASHQTANSQETPHPRRSESHKRTRGQLHQKLATQQASDPPLRLSPIPLNKSQVREFPSGETTDRRHFCPRKRACQFKGYEPKRPLRVGPVLGGRWTALGRCHRWPSIHGGATR